MTRTSSTMLPLGSSLPRFELEVVQGTNLQCNHQFAGLKVIRSLDLSDKPLLLMVLCAHCPFVKHIEQGLTKLEKDFAETVQIIAISSNSLITHPQDAPQYLAAQATKNGWSFPYLIDSDQSLAKKLQAACTPDFLVFGSMKSDSKKLLYRGQLDESRPGNDIPVTGKDLRSALQAILSNKQVGSDQKPSIGCNIKWHPGEEPDWFG